MCCRSTILSDGPFRSMKVKRSGSSPGAICAGGKAPENPVTAAFPRATTATEVCCALRLAETTQPRAAQRAAASQPATSRQFRRDVREGLPRLRVIVGLLRRLVWTACAKRQIGHCARGAARPARRHLGRIAARSAGRHHLALARAGGDAFTADIDFTARARNSGQWNGTDRAVRVVGRFDRRHGRQSGRVA